MIATNVNKEKSNLGIKPNASTRNLTLPHACTSNGPLRGRTESHDLRHSPKRLCFLLTEIYFANRLQENSLHHHSTPIPGISNPPASRPRKTSVLTQNSTSLSSESNIQAKMNDTSEKTEAMYDLYLRGRQLQHFWNTVGDAYGFYGFRSEHGWAMGKWCPLSLSTPSEEEYPPSWSKSPNSLIRARYEWREKIMEVYPLTDIQACTTFDHNQAPKKRCETASSQEEEWIVFINQWYEFETYANQPGPSSTIVQPTVPVQNVPESSTDGTASPSKST